SAGAAQALSVSFTPTDGANYTTATRSVAINVLKATPTITWTTPADIIYGTALSATQLNATASVPGTFVYTPAAGAVLSAGAAQTLSVSFTPTDAANYTSATRTVSINVLKATPVLTWPTPADITYGTALSATQLNATASVPGTFVYTPAASVVLDAGANQTLSVSFTPTDAANYTSATRTVSINVLKATPVLTWSTPAAIIYGTPLSATQLNASANVAGTFVYTPPAGTVLHSSAAQTLSVTFTPGNAANYTSATASVAIDVFKATPVLTWPMPADIVYGTALSATQLNATANVPGTFVYTPAAGTVLQAGAAQTLSVRFTPTDVENYLPQTASVAITVLKATPSIAWPTPSAIVHGTPLGAAQLNATTSVPGTFAYTPAAGTVLDAGTRTLSVTFTAANAANYNSATATVTLLVTKMTPAITWPEPYAIIYGSSIGPDELNATATVPGTFTYTPAAGTVPGAGARTLSVTFTPTDTVNYTATAATTTLIVLQAPAMVSWPQPAAIVYGTALSATQLNATADVPGTFVYTPAAGAVLPAGNGQELEVLFTPDDSANYSSTTTTVLIDVIKGTPAITWNAPAAIVYGTPLSATQLNATASVPGTFVYSPAAGTVLNAGTGRTLSVTFTPTDAANYAAATATTSIDVFKATPVLTWPTPADIVYGTALSATQLNATSNVPGTFVYDPAAGVVLNAGAAQTLSVSFTPTDAANYTSATRTVSINVLKATPVITWSTPADIIYGTALSATQLNASASVPGTFVYTPAAGVVLSAGAAQTLSV